MELKDRIQQIMNREKLSASVFADSIGVQRSSISHIISGRNKPSLEFIQKILQAYPKYNTDWLILGKGDIDTHKQHESNIAINNTPNHVNNTLFTSENIKSKDLQANKNDSKTEVSDEDPPLYTSKKQPLPTKNEGLNQTLNDNERTVEKIVIFYNDKTVSVYNPE